MEYQPKHLKKHERYMGHCCFGGCTPMGCPGGCCANDFWHHPGCDLNSMRLFDEAEHDAYVNAGLRKHLFNPHEVPSDRPRRRPPLRVCDCGNIAWYANGCAPSGCQNRPA